MMRWRIVPLLLLIGLFLWATPIHAQPADPSTDTCENVSYLMARDITPYDMSLSGGTLRSGASTSGALGAGAYADFWTFALTRPRNANNVIQDLPVSITFSNVSGVALEFALFNGINPVIGYQPITSETQVSYSPSAESAAYTLVVRKVNLADERAGNYTLTVRATPDSSMTEQVVLSVRDETTNRDFAPAPALSNGVMRVTAAAAEIFIHPDGTRRVHPRGGNSTQIFMPNDRFDFSAHTINVGNWANKLSFLGGDFAATGAQRIYFLENFDFRINFSGTTPTELNLQNITYGDGTSIRTDWANVAGLWVMTDCVGVKLRDGRTFTAQIGASSRELRAEGDLSAFTLVTNAIASSGAPARHTAVLDWSIVREASQIRVRDGVYALDLIADRQLAVQTTDWRMTTTPNGDDIATTTIALNDQVAEILLDWSNMRGFDMQGGIITLDFLDAPRTTTTRSGVNLARFEARDDIIHITYKDDGTTPGEQRLLLPASDSYIEIITPAGLPPFMGTVTAGEIGYMPRALNNTGGECYPTSTLIPEANCPPVGEINPANGNLWLSVDDHTAFGDLLDMALIRNYNSRYSFMDSPFGFGWTTNFLLDYNIPYDAQTNSRPIDPVAVRNFNIGLDVTFAPRGVVVFTTASGSRHQFVGDARYTSGVMRAVTMPGWTLQRTSVRDATWQLAQDDGMVYQFDRAGRLVSYGYPTHGRVITIAYPRATREGAAGIGEDVPVVITDSTGDFDLRRLELYYDTQHRIVKSILRDMTFGADETTCDYTDNCFVTTYTYADGYLVSVTYPDGVTADYRYNEAGQLSAYTDPRMPIAQQRAFTYAETGDVAIVEVQEGDTAFLTHLLDITTTADRRIARLTDRLGNVREYSYVLSMGDLRSVGTSYMLVGETSPLAGTGDRLEDVPLVYRWGSDQNPLLAGFLTRIEARGTGANQGRASRDYNYTPNGQLQCVACSFQSLPRLEVVYDQPLERRADRYRPTRVNYADGTSEQFTYNADGLLVRYIDRDGADYAFTWTDEIPFQIASIRRANDGVAWEYFYNPVGLVVSMIQSTPNDSTPYQVGYQWDGVGRLIAINDGVLGRYSIEYVPPRFDDAEHTQIVTEIYLTDPLGTLTISKFDARGQLISTIVQAGDTPLRETLIAYDALGRVVRVMENVGNLNPVEFATLLVTSYDYSLTPSYLATNGTEIVVRGEALVVTDPYGRTSTTIVDALGRVRRTIDETGLIQDFSYTNAFEGANFGLQITHLATLPGTTFSARTDYTFDIRRQLRGVRRSAFAVPDGAPAIREWVITAFGDTARQRTFTASIEGRTATWREIVWGDYVNGKPPSVSTSQANIALNSTLNIETQHRPSQGVTYDFLARPTQIITGDSTTPIAYCPLAGGNYEVLYGATTCASTQYLLRLRYDVHDRLIEAQDDLGARRITYAPSVGQFAWEAVVTFLAKDEQQSPMASWTLRFDTLGQLTHWIDQDGIEQTYGYDTRGRLRTIVVPEMPEMSFTFRYNVADQLTEISDDLGRGFLYSYDAQGRVISKVDLRTADTISYAYTPAGLLASAVASDGGTTIYLYEDRADPTRLTRIIEPSGAQHQYEWSDFNADQSRLTNALRYTDPFGNRTDYRYDGSGLLWRIDYPDGAGGSRSSEFHYTTSGRLVAWLRAVTAANATSQRLNIARNGHIWTVTDGAPNGTGWSGTFSFTSDGRLENANGGRITYDSLGRLVHLDGGGLEWTLTYNNAGAIVINDPLAGASTLRFDALYRLVAHEARGETLAYDYVVGEGNTATMRVSHPTLGEREYIFFPGDVRTGTPPSVFLRAYGSETTYSYDGEGRLTEIATRVCSDDSYANIFDCITDAVPLWTTRATITYNAVGLPIRVTDVDGNLETFAYDDEGRLIAYQNANGRNFTYNYDTAGRLVTLTTATGVKLVMRYNVADDLTGVCRTRASASDSYADCVGAGGELVTYAYDTLGRVTAQGFPNGNANATITYRYDAAGNLVSMGDVEYGYTRIGLLDAMTVRGTGEYALTYAALNRLAGIGDQTYTYDAFGDLRGIADGAVNLTYTHDPATHITTFADGNNRQTYALDPRGYLRSIAFNDALVLEAEYLATQSGVDLIWLDDTLVAYTLNNQRQTDNLLLSGGNDMSIYYDLSGTGRVRRQNIILPFADGGYVAIYGYDNDERPLTMRLTDFRGLTVLFSQSITYNPAGLRDSETWQYADGRQVIIRYRYANNSQLAERTITILTDDGASTLRYTYAYDNAGNLRTITEANSNETCVTFGYDGANRLISQTTNDGIVNYAYDAFNRLVRVGNDIRISYRGGSDEVLAVSVGNSPSYLGHIQNQPAGFQLAQGGFVTWLLNDGRNRIIQAYPDGTPPPDDVWVFDALGRYIVLDVPSLAPCAISPAPDRLTPSQRVQPLVDGAIWLPELGLYVQAGRAYETTTGIFMQRALDGLDVLGTAYGGFDRTPIPQLITDETLYGTGLHLLRDAMAQGNITQTLTAEAVLRRYTPRLIGNASAIADAERQAREGLLTTMSNLFALPTWLETGYNLPNAYRDADGFLRMVAGDTPGQGGRAGGTDLRQSLGIPDWREVLMSSIRAPQTIVAGIMGASERDRARGNNSYDAHGWRNTPITLAKSWATPRPYITGTPADVLAWLPTPLGFVTAGAHAVDVAQGLAQLPHTTPADWLAVALADALPTTPALPPADLTAWRADVMRDTFIGGGGGVRLPSVPALPAYPLGMSHDWLHGAGG